MRKLISIPSIQPLMDKIPETCDKLINRSDFIERFNILFYSLYRYYIDPKKYWQKNEYTSQIRGISIDNIERLVYICSNYKLYNYRTCLPMESFGADAERLTQIIQSQKPIPTDLLCKLYPIILTDMIEKNTIYPRTVSSVAFIHSQLQEMLNYAVNNMSSQDCSIFFMKLVEQVSHSYSECPLIKILSLKSTESSAYRIENDFATKFKLFEIRCFLELDLTSFLRTPNFFFQQAHSTSAGVL